MNSYDPYVCDFKLQEKIAKGMSKEQLEYSIKDCSECIQLGINPNKYYDQISVYRMEIIKRERKGK